MKRYGIVLLFCWGLLGGLSAQQSIPQILQEIENNNKELQANRQLIRAQKLEAGLNNNLPDPSVSYVHQYGNKSGLGMQGELVASQAFDFPSLYVQRNKLNKATGSLLERQGAGFRQQVLLQAKEVCLDLVLLNQQQHLLDLRLQNARQLAELYAVRLKNGDANILETNKIDLELLNARNEARMNETSRKAKLRELASLNGGIEIPFADTVYTQADALESFPEFQAEAMTANPQLLQLQGEQAVANRQISVNKSKGLPAFEVGYRLNTATGGERFNGFLVGMSIPLFSNRNYVKQARAQQRYVDLQLEQTTVSVTNELLQLYNQAQAVKASMDEYSEVLKSQNNLMLLNKAIQAGQISMIEYFVDVSTLYESMQNYMQLQNEYYKLLAQLYKYKL